MSYFVELSTLDKKDARSIFQKDQIELKNLNLEEIKAILIERGFTQDIENIDQDKNYFSVFYKNDIHKGQKVFKRLSISNKKEGGQLKWEKKDY